MLSGNDLTSQQANISINKALEVFNPADLQASHHVDLNTGREGYINDNDPNSYLYKGGKTVRGEGKEFANPIKGKGAGAKELKQMTPEEYRHFNNIFEQQQIYRQGTGDWAGGVINEVPFA